MTDSVAGVERVEQRGHFAALQNSLIITFSGPRQAMRIRLAVPRHVATAIISLLCQRIAFVECFSTSLPRQNGGGAPAIAVLLGAHSLAEESQLLAALQSTVSKCDDRR